MSTYHFRPATAADQDTLWRMLYLALFVPPGTEQPPASIIADPSIARYAAHWRQRAGDLGVIATLDDQPVGAAWIRYFSAWANWLMTTNHTNLSFCS